MKYFKCLNNVEFKVARNLATFCDQNAYVLSWNRLRIATLLGNIIREVDLNGLYYNENNIFGNREIHSTRIARIKLSCIILLNFFRLSKISRLFSVFLFYLKGD